MSSQPGGEEISSQVANQVDPGGLAALRPGHVSFPEASFNDPLPHSTIDIISLPDPGTVLRLAESYFDHIGALFPYLHPETFFETYTQFRAGSCKVRRTWLAILNLILALALQRNSDKDRNSELCYEDSWPYLRRATILCDRQKRQDVSLETGTSLEVLHQHRFISTRSICLQPLFRSSIPITPYTISARHERSRIDVGYSWSRRTDSIADRASFSADERSEQSPGARNSDQNMAYVLRPRQVTILVPPGPSRN